MATPGIVTVLRPIPKEENVLLNYYVIECTSDVDASFYEFEINTQADFLGTNIISPTSQTFPAYQLSPTRTVNPLERITLPANTTLYVRAQAVGSLGELGGYSQVVEFKTEAGEATPIRWRVRDATTWVYGTSLTAGDVLTDVQAVPGYVSGTEEIIEDKQL